ncbi:hypothetical protein CVT24_011967 [Panaeolus cyanescens]|uniref:Rhodopsin domain-containing protein n=1 Tax=Panaeolus cyanescens TaxID=181874 RepID=A0A409VYX7_9AGAR|nr:hypothetical protein CVT24_011967 [Panaeolus cyanescens]
MGKAERKLAAAAQSLLAWQICLTVFHSIAIGFIIARLVHRWRTRKLWWDDYIILLPFVTDIAYLSVNWTIYSESNQQSDGPYRNFIYSLWFSKFMFFTIVWTSRISLAISLARIFKVGHACRRFAFGLVMGFVSIYISLVLVTTLTCRLGPTWYKSRKCAEVSGRPLGLVLSVAFDFLSDAIFLVSPLVILNRANLTPKQRATILCLFSTSIFTLLTSIMFAVTWFLAPEDNTRSEMLLNMTALLQVASCLLVCNIAIITLLFCRAFCKKKISEDDDAENGFPSSGVNRIFIRSPSPQLSTPQSARTLRRNRSLNTYREPQLFRTSSPLTPSSRYTPITLTSIYDDSVWSSFTGSMRSWMTRNRSLPSTHDSQIATSVPSWNYTISIDSGRSDPQTRGTGIGGRGLDFMATKES